MNALPELTEEQARKIAIENLIYRYACMDFDDYSEAEYDRAKKETSRWSTVAEIMRYKSFWEKQIYTQVKDVKIDDLRFYFVKASLLDPFWILQIITHFRPDIKKIALYIFCHCPEVNSKSIQMGKFLTETEIMREVVKLATGQSTPLVMQDDYFEKTPELIAFKKRIMYVQDDEPETEAEPAVQESKKSRFWPVSITMGIALFAVFVIKNDQDPTWWPDLIEGLSRVTFW